ncbi:MAG: M1 family metallopeptidase [Draconibacterium sp.]|nr:M1 family metallopeptidase [Draconibacterium sp.]
MKQKLLPKQIISSIILVLFIFSATAQNHQARFESIDILHYSFEIHLNDSTNRIEGKATISLNFIKPVKQITLDLIEPNDSTQTGMIVSSVTKNGSSLTFKQQNNQLKIQLSEKSITDKSATIQIEYTGIPADGLIISKNKFGDRTFFGDNWPNRARYWLPTVDHPSDKATLEFLVYAPEHYQVVSNGVLFETTNLPNEIKFTHWKESVPLSTKLMVIGVARFAVRNNGSYKYIPVSSWVYPQNRENGFKDYAIGKKALQYFSEKIGFYSYEKLAHVQSKTRYGGMENASCIFYSERTVNGKNGQESLFAHETAHQWFGNSVTEQNWHHIWLSEGFATYLTHVYNQHFHGEKYFRNGLKRDRERVIAYSKRRLAPIIDTTITNYNRLLSTNSYQKASWFLHMLRNKTSDSIFFAGLQKYYHNYQNSTALTKDFKNVMESVSGLELDSFFHQWLWQPGHPNLKVKWENISNKKLKIIVEQTQPDYIFSFPLEIEIRYKNGDADYKTIQINDSKKEVSFSIKNEVKNIIIDPSVRLLLEKTNLSNVN